MSYYMPTLAGGPKGEAGWTSNCQIVLEAWLFFAAIFYHGLLSLGTAGTIGTVLAIHVFRPGVKFLLAIDVSDRERKSSRVVSETRSAPQVVLSSPDAV